MFYYYHKNSFVESKYELNSTIYQITVDPEADLSVMYYKLTILQSEFYLKYGADTLLTVLNQRWPAQPKAIASKLREAAYEKFSDPLYIAYQRYATFGPESEVENALQNWKAKLDEIDYIYPYSDQEQNIDPSTNLEIDEEDPE